MQLVLVFIAAELLVLIFYTRRILMAVQPSDLLTQIATIGTDLQALIAGLQAGQTPPPDLQPVADALTALDSAIKAATPASSGAATPAAAVTNSST